MEKTAQGIVRTVKSFSYPKICKFISIFFIFFIFHQNCIFAQQDDKGIDGPKLISKRFVPLPQLQTPTPVEEIKSVPQEQEVEEKKEIMLEKLGTRPEIGRVPNFSFLIYEFCFIKFAERH